MNRTLFKSLIRLIRTSLSRYLAVFAIVTIGVAFFTGVSGTSDIMSASVDVYDDETNLKDLTVYSNYGFEEEDLEAIRTVEGVKEVQGDQFTDAIGICGKDSWITRIHSFNDERSVSQFVLVSGRMPQNEHEALAENGSELEPGFALGSRVDLVMPEGGKNENLKSDWFIITGTVDTPLYLNEIKENSTLSNQYIRSYLYVRDDVFTNDFYTEVNVLTENGKAMNSFSDAYETYSKEVRDAIRTLGKTQADERRKRIVREAEAEYEDDMQEYLKAKKEYEDEIRNAEKEIADGQKEIEEGEAALADGIAQLNEGQRQLNEQLADGLRQLEEGRKILADQSLTFEEKKKEFEKQKQELRSTQAQLKEGIASLQAAKDGLKQIDEGIAQIAEAEKQLNDPKAALLMNMLSQLDPEMPLEDLKQPLEDLDEIRTLILENFPELAEITPKDILDQAETIRQDCENDRTVLEQEETLQAIEQLRAMDPSFAVDELSEEYKALIEIIKRWNPEAEINDVSSLLSGYDNALERISFVQDVMASDLYTALEEEIGKLDPDEPISSVMEFDPAQIDEMVSMLEEAGSEKIETIGDLIAAYEKIVSDLAAQKEELVTLRADIVSKLAEQGIKEEEIDASIAEMQDLIDQIESGIAEGEALIADAEKQLAYGYAQLNASQNLLDVMGEEGRRQLAEAQAEINANTAKLNDAKAQIARALKDLAEGKEEGQKQLADAKRQLDEAREQIDSLEKGSWTVLDRTSHYASATYHATIDQMKAIGDIFPLFFICVAALVCLTTMTRMVSERRGETGAMRALGYSRFQCALRYLIYAFSATLLGCVIGTLIGLQTFPRIIYNTWRMMYILPDIVITVPWKLVLMTAAMFLGSMTLTTWLVLRNDMKEVPSQLLRPKAVAAGRKTLIERIPFIWKRLSFTWKVTMRNIFRYKRRFIMTILGVAGCCALMVTGFGIRDSINGMVDLQFYEILQFDGAASVSKDADEEQLEELERKLEKRDDVRNIMLAYNYSAKANDVSGEGLDETVSAQIFLKPEDIKEAYLLRDRKTHNPIELNNEGAVISEKLSENLNLKAGDILKMEDEDGVMREVKIAAVCEMYIQHYVFMTADYYESLSGKPAERRALFITGMNSDDTHQLQDDLLNEPLISGISFYDETLQNFSTMVKSLDLIVWTLIISSMALAFVVLGNLIRINVAERQREIATLKVLGFRRKEVQSYIFKENNILTIAGAIAGLPLGNVLEQYIMGCIEMDYVMFGRRVMPMSFVISACMTVAFGMIVNIAMVKTLDSIKMVESLKSVE